MVVSGTTRITCVVKKGILRITLELDGEKWSHIDRWDLVIRSTYIKYVGFILVISRFAKLKSHTCDNLLKTQVVWIWYDVC